MNEISLKKLAELNSGKFGIYRRAIEIKKHLNECGLKWVGFEVWVGLEVNNFLEIPVCDVNEDGLFEKFYKSNIKLVEPYQSHVNMDLYEDIKNDVATIEKVKMLGCMYFVQDGDTYRVGVFVKKNEKKVDVMFDFMLIHKVDDNKVPLVIPERFTIVYGYNTKDYYVYDEIEDVYYELDELLNDELKDRIINEAREELIREDTSWFVEKNIFPEDCDL